MGSATVLTAPEQTRLDSLEVTIQAGLDTFHEVGLALLEVRDHKLYRAGWESFEHYVQDRWHFSRSQAYRLIDAAKIADELSPNGGQINERQARELARIPDPEARKAVWEAASSDGSPTASRIQDLAAKALEGKTPEEVRDIISAEEKKLHEQAPVVLGGEGWPQTLEQIVRLCKRVRRLVERRGAEADNALPHLDSFLAIVQSWDA